MNHRVDILYELLEVPKARSVLDMTLDIHRLGSTLADDRSCLRLLACRDSFGLRRNLLVEHLRYWQS